MSWWSKERIAWVQGSIDTLEAHNAHSSLPLSEMAADIIFTDLREALDEIAYLHSSIEIVEKVIKDKIREAPGDTAPAKWCLNVLQKQMSVRPIKEKSEEDGTHNNKT